MVFHQWTRQAPSARSLHSSGQDLPGLSVAAHRGWVPGRQKHYRWVKMWILSAPELVGQSCMQAAGAATVKGRSAFPMAVLMRVFWRNDRRHLVSLVCRETRSSGRPSVPCAGVWCRGLPQVQPLSSKPPTFQFRFSLTPHFFLSLPKDSISGCSAALCLPPSLWVLLALGFPSFFTLHPLNTAGSTEYVDNYLCNLKLPSSHILQSLK